LSESAYNDKEALKSERAARAKENLNRLGLNGSGWMPSGGTPRIGTYEAPSTGSTPTQGSIPTGGGIDRPKIELDTLAPRKLPPPVGKDIGFSFYPPPKGPGDLAKPPTGPPVKPPVKPPVTTPGPPVKPPKKPGEENFDYSMPKMKRPLLMPDAAVTPESDPLRQIKLQENNYVDFSDPARRQSNLAARMAGGQASGNAGMAMGMMAQAGRVDQLANINNQEAQRSQQVSDSNVGIRNQQTQMNFNAMNQNDANNAANRAAAQDINRENISAFRERRDNAFQNERTDLKDQMLFNENRRQYNEFGKRADREHAEAARQYDLQHELATNQQKEHANYNQQRLEHDKQVAAMYGNMYNHGRDLYGQPGSHIGLGQGQGQGQYNPNPPTGYDNYGNPLGPYKYKKGVTRLNISSFKGGTKQTNC
jgi:hypothetical protein